MSATYVTVMMLASELVLRRGDTEESKDHQENVTSVPDLYEETRSGRLFPT